MVGVGLTVTENVEGVPGQLLKVGNTEMVPTIVPGVLLFVLLGAVHGEICPAPDTPKPILALVLVHVKVAPTGFETKALGLIVDPGQVTMGLNGPTLATGCTMMVVLSGIPTQPLAEGTTMYVNCCGVLVLLIIGVVRVAVLLPGDKFPLAVATTPGGTVVDHAKVLGLMDELNVMTAFPPEQIGPTVAGEVATGNGFTNTVAVDVAGLQGPAGSLVVKVKTAVPV